VDTNFYIGYQTIDLVTGIRSLAYVEPLRTISISQTATQSGTFGPNVASATVGQSVSNLNVKANSPIALNINSANNLGSAFSYFSEWDYIGSSTITGWSTYGTCYVVSYLYYKTNYAAYLLGATFTSSYKSMKGVVCTCDLSGSITGASITLSTGYLPAKWAITIPGYGAISDDSGKLRYYNTNYANIGGSLTVSNIIFPVVGPSMTNAVGSWYVPLPVNLDRSILLRIAGNPVNTNLPFLFTGTCAVYNNIME